MAWYISVLNMEIQVAETACLYKKNRSHFLCNLAAKARELGLANWCTMLEFAS